ncbi:MAG: beta-N-acetylhexosaminidase, partial [Chitinispirillaceae bacterium]|nr:beta-N-acetylhexosaminidase [Chitinispirillaceae bacterium]
MNIIIPPKKIAYLGGKCELTKRIKIEGDDTLQRKYSSLINAILKSEDVEDNKKKESLKIEFSFLPYVKYQDSYNIIVKEREIDIKGGSERGIYYAIQTLSQLISENDNILPCIEIKDEPEFANRGFLHDITRGKVPTLSTLKKIVDKCSEYRIN